MIDQIDGDDPDSDGAERITATVTGAYEPGLDDFHDPHKPRPDLIRLEVECRAHIDLIRGAINRALRTWAESTRTPDQSEIEYLKHDTGLYGSTLLIVDEPDARGEFLIRIDPLSDQQTRFRAWAWGEPHKKLIPLIKAQLKPYEDRAAQAKRLRAQGLKLKEIAARLSISLATVKRDLK